MFVRLARAVRSAFQRNTVNGRVHSWQNGLISDRDRLFMKGTGRLPCIRRHDLPLAFAHTGSRGGSFHTRMESPLSPSQTD